MHIVTMCLCGIALVDELLLHHFLPSNVIMHAIRGILSALYITVCHYFMLCFPHARLPANPTQPTDHAS